ncbi:MAG: hypothetical protein GX262_00680 [Clostridia bacterium]|jgi:hypothetical protein|nr:hypothetical protein [Clostridia bacterium]
MEYYISHSFVRKVSLVVLTIDDFTGKPIPGSNVRVYIEGERPAIKKNDGYHVFVNLDRPAVTVHAVGGQYNPRSIRCDLSTSEDNYTFLKLRMIPNRSYPIPQNTTCIEGKAAPGSLIRIFCHEGAYKLLYDYKKEKGSDNRRISIFHPDDMDMEGKLLHITDSGGKNRELLRITGVLDKENKLYLLEKELSADYKKIGTSLFTVYETGADQNGSFFLPIANTYKEKCLYTCEAIGEKPVSAELELESGRVNKIDLR